MFNDYSKTISGSKYKTKYGEGLKMLTLKQILQKLPIAIAQVKAGNISKKLLNEIRQIIYPLYRPKEITKKVYNNIVISIMDTIFMNSKISKIPDPYRLILNLTDKINLKRSYKHVALLNLSMYYTWKKYKNVI